MKNALRILLALLLLLAACGDDRETSGTNAAADAGESFDAGTDAEIEPATLRVTTEATYEWETSDVVYGEGLVHSAWNSTETETKVLEATIWDPQGTPDVRPAILIVHGGGFLGGQRDQSQLVDFAEFFAARGWFVMSISYRLFPDKPTMPAEWSDGIDASEFGTLEKELGRTMYGSTRDAKAAVRYLQANADNYGIAPKRIAAMGGSAGSFICLGLGVSEPEDFRDELLGEDPTLESTNLEQDGKIVAVLDHWGGPEVLTAFELVYGLDRWDSADAPTHIVHGTADNTVDVASAEAIRDHMIENGVTHTYFLIPDAGHGPWNATIDGKSLHDLGFEFLVEHQGLEIDEP